MATRKDHPETSDEGQAAKAEAEAAVAETTAEVQQAVDTETEQGFRGVEVDPVPNENYTVAGVLAGAPVPETDAETADEVEKHVRKLAGPGNGLGPR